MTTGLKIPVGVGTSGGAAIERDDGQQMLKILMLALSAGDDNNAFQSLGRELNGLVFNLKNPTFQARAKVIIQRVLAKFSERVSLAPSSDFQFVDTAEGEVELQFEYVDLQTGRVQEFRKKFTR
jgi:hypothetical protein